MANPCSPNSSEPKDGIGSYLVFDAAKIGQFLLQTGMGWLSPLVPEIGGKTYNLSDFCASDPPDEPTTDPGDIAQFFNPLNPTGQADLKNWLTDVVNHFVWFQSCQCSSGPQPTPPSPISQPTDVNFQPPSTTTGDHCFAGTATHTPNYANVIAWNFNDALPPGTSPYTDGEFTRPPIPQPTPSSITFTAIVGSGGAHATAATFLVNFYNASGSAISASTYLSPSVATSATFNSPVIPVPTNAAYWQIIANKDESGSTHATNSIEVDVTVYCQGQGPNNLGMVCCPTDPNLLAMIQQILDQLQFLESIIPARAPTYAERSTTTGLSDTGNFTVADDVIAVKIALTTIPAYIGKLDGLPITYFGVGWVTPTTDSGPQAGIPISRATQVFPLPEATTGLDYALSPGVVISITELLAG